MRTDLSARQVVAGTLGYQGFFSVVSELGRRDTHLRCPRAGDVVRRGQPLFAVSGQPVTLLYGSLPAWRPFAPGMTAGPDVRQLQRNLAALGFDPGPADGVFGWSTQLAVERWQQARGVTVTGTIPLGDGRVPARAAARHHDVAGRSAPWSPRAPASCPGRR